MKTCTNCYQEFPGPFCPFGTIWVGYYYCPPCEFELAFKYGQSFIIKNEALFTLRQVDLQASPCTECPIQSKCLTLSTLFF